MDTQINSHGDLKNALARLWVAETECKLARARLQQVSKEIMGPVKLLRDEVKLLQPKIQAYMIQHELPRVKANGKEFVLRQRRSKRKLDLDELCKLFEDNNITTDESTIDNIKQSAGYRTSHKVVIPKEQEQEAIVLSDQLSTAG